MSLDLVNNAGNARSQSQSIISMYSTDEDIHIKEEFDSIVPCSPTPPQQRTHPSEWAILPGMNTKRSRFASAMCNETLYVFGGSNGKRGRWGSRLDGVESYDPIKKEWTDLPSMTISRAGCTASVVGHQIFLFGGAESSYNHPSKSCEIFDTTTMEFTKLGTEMNFGRDRHASVAVGKKIYVFGGHKRRGSGECYDMDTKTWTAIAPMIEPRYSFGAVAVGNKIYAIGGMKDLDSGGSRNPCTSQYARHLETMEIYDIASDQWTLSPERMKNRRSGCAVIKIKDQNGTTITVFGGMAANKEDGRLEYVHATETYHVEKAKWSGSFIPPLLNARSEFCAQVVVENELLVIGGKNDSGNHDQIESCIVPDIVSKHSVSNSLDTDFGIPAGNCATNIINESAKQSKRTSQKAQKARKASDHEHGREQRRTEPTFRFKAAKVAKEFGDGHTYFGEVAEYDPESMTWGIKYRDGDFEADVERAEVLKGKKLYSALKKLNPHNHEQLPREKASNGRKRASNDSISSKARKISKRKQGEKATPGSKRPKNDAILSKELHSPKKLMSSHQKRELKNMFGKFKTKLSETRKKEKEMIGEEQRGLLEDRIEQLQHISELVTMEVELFGSSQKGSTVEERMEKVKDRMKSL